MSVRSKRRRRLRRRQEGTAKRIRQLRAQSYEWLIRANATILGTQWEFRYAPR